MKKILLAVLLALPMGIFAQHEFSAFTATGRGGVSTTFVRDYEVAGINPANLGMIGSEDSPLEKEKVVSFGIGESVLSASSSALTRPELSDNFFSFGALQGFDTLTRAEKSAAAIQWAGDGINLQADVMAFGIAVQPKRNVGGFSFMVRDRFTTGVELNSTGAAILFQGYNYSNYFDSLDVNGTDTVGWATQPQTFTELFGGTKLRLTWYREWSLNYGRVVVDDEDFKLYAGLGGKYCQGIGLVDIRVSGEPNATPEEKFYAVSALSPIFDIDYGNNVTPSAVTGTGMKSVGSGFGLDAGITMTFGPEEKMKVGVSVTNIGSITWNGNVYSAKDTFFLNTGDAGFDSYNVINEAESVTGDGSFFNWEGETDIKAKLPTMLRVGTSYRFHPMFEAGLDVVLPLNDAVGNFEKFAAAIGVDFRPVEWLRISSGVNANDITGVSIPIGLYLQSPKESFEIGIASRDAVTYFTQQSPNLSLAIGLLRFKF